MDTNDRPLAGFSYPRTAAGHACSLPPSRRLAQAIVTLRRGAVRGPGLSGIGREGGTWSFDAGGMAARWVNWSERAGLFTSGELPRGMCRIPYDWRGDPELAHAIASQAGRPGTWITAIDDPCLPEFWRLFHGCAGLAGPCCDRGAGLAGQLRGILAAPVAGGG